MTATLQIGDRAPAFDLAKTGGSTCSLQSLAGRKAVLYFYPKDDTSGCTQEAIDFNRLGRAFAEADTAVIGVSPDPIASHDKFKAKHALDLTLLSDESKAMLEAYGVWTEKSMYGRR
jgi:peroxiredoxin Q/BCP